MLIAVYNRGLPFRGSAEYSKHTGGRLVLRNLGHQRELISRAFSGGVLKLAGAERSLMVSSWRFLRQERASPVSGLPCAWTRIDSVKTWDLR